LGVALLLGGSSRRPKARPLRCLDHRLVGVPWDLRVHWLSLLWRGAAATVHHLCCYRYTIYAVN
ncbi:unnamed protein product, partial [Closterium sp. NIES-53]